MVDYPEREQYIAYIMEHRQSYYRLAYSFMGNEADSMDAMSQLMLTVVEKGHTLRQPQAFPAWSKKVLVNACRSRLKERSRREMPMEIPISLAEADSGGLSHEDRLSLRAAVQALPESQREVVVLRYYLGYEYKEIAEALHLPPGTVKSRLHRAIRQLQDIMQIIPPLAQNQEKEGDVHEIAENEATN